MIHIKFSMRIDLQMKIKNLNSIANALTNDPPLLSFLQEPLGANMPASQVLVNLIDKEGYL